MKNSPTRHKDRCTRIFTVLFVAAKILDTTQKGSSIGLGEINDHTVKMMECYAAIKRNLRQMGKMSKIYC